jgi:hypothetical protein
MARSNHQSSISAVAKKSIVKTGCCDLTAVNHLDASVMQAFAQAGDEHGISRPPVPSNYDLDLIAGRCEPSDRRVLTTTIRRFACGAQSHQFFADCLTNRTKRAAIDLALLNDGFQSVKVRRSRTPNDATDSIGPV